MADLYNNDTVWAAFYRDGKTLGELCQEFNCNVSDLSPWLTAPLTKAILAAIAPKSKLTSESE